MDLFLVIALFTLFNTQGIVAEEQPSFESSNYIWEAQNNFTSPSCEDGLNLTLVSVSSLQYSDRVEFTITNFDAKTVQVDYIITQDDILMLNGQVTIGANDNITVVYRQDQSTYQEIELEVESVTIL